MNSNEMSIITGFDVPDAVTNLLNKAVDLGVVDTREIVVIVAHHGTNWKGIANEMCAIAFADRHSPAGIARHATICALADKVEAVEQKATPLVSLEEEQAARQVFYNYKNMSGGIVLMQALEAAARVRQAKRDRTMRAGYVLAMAILQSPEYERGDEELREAVRYFTPQGGPREG